MSSTSPRRLISHQKPPVFLRMALLYRRHTNDHGVKVFSPRGWSAMRNRLIAGNFIVEVDRGFELRGSFDEYNPVLARQKNHM